MLMRFYELGTPAERAAQILGIPVDGVREFYKNRVFEATHGGEARPRQIPKAESNLYSEARRIADAHLEAKKNEKDISERVSNHR